MQADAYTQDAQRRTEASVAVLYKAVLHKEVLHRTVLHTADHTRCGTQRFYTQRNMTRGATHTCGAWTHT